MAQMIKISQLMSKLVWKHKKKGVCRTALATSGQVTLVQGVPLKTWFRETNLLHQDSKVGNKNEF